MEKSEFIRLTSASREAQEKLTIYETMLIEWNQKFNLIAPSTVEHIWSRHFLDSAQLMPILPQDQNQKVLFDLGSGAGFPGLVLSVMGVSNVNLVESTGKKADFLRAVAEKLELDVTVHQCRIEDLKGSKADIITARALAPLGDLLSLAQNLVKKDSLLLFLKGQKVDVELTESRKYWMFDCIKTKSLSDPSGSILAIRNLKISLAGQALARRAPKRHKNQG